MELYAILLKEVGTLPAVPLATDLGRILNRPLGELTKRFREQPWILAEGVSAVSIDEVFEALGRHGVVAKAVPEAHMPVLPRALRVRVADPTPESLFLTVAEPPAPAVLHWPKLELVSAGQVRLADEEAGRIFGAWQATPGSAPLSPARATAEPLLVDLFGEDGRPIRLRIDAGNFNYDYLKGRMKTSSRENLRQLLADIRDRAPHAHFTDRTEALMRGDPAAQYRFRSLEAFRTWNRWVMQAYEEQEPEG